MLCGSLAAGRPSGSSYQPPTGCVPDAKTAVRIAIAVWSPIYGEKRIQGERPFHAFLQHGVWTVTGSLPRLKGNAKAVGGVAFAEIAQRDGRVLRVIHGK